MGISSINDFSANAAGAAQAATDYQRTQLEQRLSEGYKDPKAEELMDACKSFESYFMEQVLKEVDKSTPLFGTGLGGDSYASQMTDLYKDQMIQTMATQLTDHTGNTLAKQLYEQMKRNYGITDGTEAKKPEPLNGTSEAKKPETENETTAALAPETEEEQHTAGVSLAKGEETAAEASFEEEENQVAGISIREE
ncbi:MAG: hypothetical protein IJT05_06480 [Lachnospiraceae bacterium]|nr:hypothetical protein [Lachnospiraceae bacterium]MBQ7506960.1 hypothetical protein [Lachnospiraceae bacterium]